MSLHSIPALVDLSYGIFAVLTASFVLFYKKNYAHFIIIAILLFAEGAYVITGGFLDYGSSRWVFKLYFLGRAVTPLFILVFSEYELKINYGVRLKIFCLAGTVFTGFFSFFQRGNNTGFYGMANHFFFIAVAAIVLARATISFPGRKDLLLRFYLLLFLCALGIILINEALPQTEKFPYTFYTSGISSFVLTHAIIIIITSGGFRMRKKIIRLAYITLFSLLLPLAFKGLFPQVSSGQQLALFILSSSALSVFYMVGEVSKNPKELGSASLIARFLKMPLNDMESLFDALRKWREVEHLHFIGHHEAEGNIHDLNMLFLKTKRIVHGYQVAGLMKALAYHPGLISGIEMAQYYLRKLDCDSLFQVSESGDFIGIKYIEGLNPALFSNELILMSKIIFSGSDLKTQCLK